MTSKILCPGSFVMAALTKRIVVTLEWGTPSWLRIRGNHIQGSSKTKSSIDLWSVHPNLIKLDKFFTFLMSFSMFKTAKNQKIYEL